MEICNPPTSEKFWEQPDLPTPDFEFWVYDDSVEYYGTSVVCEACGGEGCPYCFNTGVPPSPDFDFAPGNEGPTSGSDTTTGVGISLHSPAEWRG